jgi:hypothetical protein
VRKFNLLFQNGQYAEAAKVWDLTTLSSMSSDRLLRYGFRDSFQQSCIFS